MRQRVQLVAVLAALALLAWAAPAVAAWQAIPAPGPQIDDFAVADASAWLVQAAFCCPAGFQLTDDGGATWEPVQIAGYEYAKLIGAAADGSFRVLAWKGGSGDTEMRVFRVASDGSSEPLGAVIEGRPSFNYDGAVTANGDTWLPYRSEAENAFELAIVKSEGSGTTTTLPVIAGTQGWGARETAFGPRLLRFGTEGPYAGVFSRGTYQLGAGGELLPAETYPVDYADSDFEASSELGRASWDGGAHWAETPGSFIERSPGLGMPRFMSGGYIAQRYSPFLFRGSGLDWPAGASSNRVVDAGSALIAWSLNTIYVHGAELPPLSTAIGDLQGDTQAMLARADQFRADAGLPPLTGDATVSQAARNHSVYSALHPDDMVNISAHEETLGKAGFTGVEPWDRCEAVGTSCNSEVMFSGGEDDPVGGWLATVYHRPLLGSPAAGVVGAAQAPGGWSVMDGKETVNQLVGPFGYPNGRWRGNDGFAGEIPDPVRSCKEGGQPIEYPVGITVSLYIPAREGSVSRIEVRKPGSSAVLPGCLLNDSDSGGNMIGMFVLDDPLVPGQTYDVHGVWNPGNDWTIAGGPIPSADLGYDWSFHFEPDSYGGRAKSKRQCRALALRTIKSVAKPRRSGRQGQVLGIEEKVTLKQKATVRLKRARLNYWTAGDRHSVRLTLGKLRGRTAHVGRTSYLRFRLPRQVVRRVIPGEPAELLLAFTGRRNSGCRHVVHVGRIRKVEIGWVRVAGPVAWVSDAGRKRR